MDYQATINGIAVSAHYPDERVEQLFLPLLKKLTALQQEKGRRILVLLAAPPAAGKSTLLSFLQHLSAVTEGITPITAIGMDGFHRYQSYLLSHTTLRDGKSIPMVNVKGAPETFDLEKLTAALAQVASGAVCPWPDYDRMLHNPVEDARLVDGSIVILEGNYLLLDADGWRELRAYADYTVRILADTSILRQRLIDRKIDTGVTPEKAAEFVDFSDIYNARLCLRQSTDADLTLLLTESGDYVPGMRIRKTEPADLPRVMEIYARARRFMAETGNPNQWGPTNWPPEALIRQDIRDRKGFVCTDWDGRVIGSFFFDFGKDIEPTYRKIQNGSWADGRPYGVVHRIASDGSRKGIGEFCLNWAYAQCGHLRIDTHGDNIVMQRLLGKLGFSQRGIIYVVEDPYPRLAYEK